jgi:PHD/YefM family antitoxin component YafN of YafNO toxin-antitoxin module
MPEGTAMLDLRRDIDSLTNFKRNTAAFLRQLRKKGGPIVLTVNGKAQLVVQDAGSYQKLLDLAERVEAIEAIKEGMSEIANGQGIGLAEAKNRARAKHGISL